MAKRCSGPNKVGEAIDTKFIVRAQCIEHGDMVDEQHAMVFLAKDAALPATLKAYEEECVRIGADPAQVAAVQRLRARVDAYQVAHADMVKVPDIGTDEQPPAL